MFGGARVLITGAHGFVGARVAQLLADQGADLVCLHQSGVPPRPDVPGRAVPIDLVGGEGLTEVAQGAEIIVHLAASSGGIQFQQTTHADVFHDNHVMTRNVLLTARSVGAQRVFLASSAVVYRDADQDLIREEAPLRAPGAGQVTGYAWSKITDEVLGSWLADGSDLDVVVGRFANVYGPGGSFDPARSTVVHGLVRKAVEAAPAGVLRIWGSGKAVRSFIYVDDCARAVLTICEHGRGGEPYNVDSGEPISIAELAAIVRDAVDPQLAFTFDDSKPEGPQRRVMDNAKLRSLGFEPQTGIRTGVHATVKSFAAPDGRPLD